MIRESIIKEFHLSDDAFDKDIRMLFDSIEFMSFIFLMEEELGIKIDEIDIEKYSTINEILQFFQKKKQVNTNG